MVGEPPSLPQFGERGRHCSVKEKGKPRCPTKTRTSVFIRHTIITSYRTMDNNIVEDILREQASKEEAAHKSIEVHKEVPLAFDLGHLLMTDPNLLDSKAFKSNPNEEMLKLTRDNTQLFINEMWNLETTRVDGFVIAKLPEPTTTLPRAKRVPKTRQPTKWELFAKKKGIQKKKKEKLVYNEEAGEWKPRFGYRSAKNEQEKQQWVVEAKNGEDPEEAFGRKKTQKKERVAKNEFNRLKNIARSSGKKVVGKGSSVPPMEILGDAKKHEPKDLERAALLAKSSTASLGKFQAAAKNEKPIKGTGGKKRKFDSNEGNIREEKDKYLKLVDEVLKEKPKINVKKAVVNHEVSEQRKNQARNQSSGGKKKFSGKKNGQNRSVGKGKGFSKGKGRK